jgi:hypothetical protein
LERLEDRSLLAPMADIVDVTPDPRNLPVGNVGINFSEPVTGVDFTDFTLTRDGQLVPLTADMLSPSMQPASSFVLNLSTVTSAAGTYQLTLVAGLSGIVGPTNDALNDNAVDTWLTTTTAPTADIVPVTPNPRSTAVGPVTINFSEPVTGVSASDFRLTRNGTMVALDTATLSGSGDSYTLDLSSVTGVSGTYVLTLNASGSGISDGAGNFLAANASTTWVTNTDTTPPTASFSSVASPRTSAVGNVVITFSKAVTGVDVTDFSLTRNGTAVSLTSLTVTGSGASYTLNLSTVTATAGSYVLTLNAAGSGIVDSGNIALTQDASIAWLTTTPDTTAPTATIAAVSPNPRTTAVGNLAITFSEPVTGLDISDFTLVRNGIIVPLTGVTITGSGANYLINLASATTVSGSYTLTLRAANSGITDLAGNAMTANATVSWVLVNTHTLANAVNLGVVKATVALAPQTLFEANDWYRFTTTRKGTAKDSVSITFTNSQGNLDLELYNVAGKRLAVSSSLTANKETISLNGLAAGTYYIRVFGKSGATNSKYNLLISF